MRNISLRKSYKRLLIFTVVVGLIYISPIWIEKYPFLESDKEWINGFLDGDTLIFHSDAACENDTIEYCYRKSGGPTNYFPFHWSRFIFLTWPFGNYGPWNSYFTIPIFWSQESGAFGYFFLRRDEKTGRIGAPHIALSYDRYTYTNKNEDIVLDSITFNKKSIPAITVNEQTAQISTGRTGHQIIREVIWSKPYGVIEYTLVTGEKYRLVEYRHADGRVERFEE